MARKHKEIGEIKVKVLLVRSKGLIGRKMLITPTRKSFQKVMVRGPLSMENTQVMGTGSWVHSLEVKL